jgi:hypothetical protein
MGATYQCGGDGGMSTCGCSLQNGSGQGGLQFVGGSTVQSAPGQGGGGGGGGYYGGGSGGGDCSLNTGGGGGGGSCYAPPDKGCVMSGHGAQPANSADPDFQDEAGKAGDKGADGKPGLVVLYY